MKLVPTFFFVDPFGYKGLSLRLVNSVLKNWGCDCVFFFNYNRINMGLGNEAVEQHMNVLFGEKRANKLRQKLATLPSHEREAAIVEALTEALRELGAGQPKSAQALGLGTQCGMIEPSHTPRDPACRALSFTQGDSSTDPEWILFDRCEDRDWPTLARLLGVRPSSASSFASRSFAPLATLR